MMILLQRTCRWTCTASWGGFGFGLSWSSAHVLGILPSRKVVYLMEKDYQEIWIVRRRRSRRSDDDVRSMEHRLDFDFGRREK